MSERAPVARGLADIAGIADRIDILAAEQFLSTNLHELSAFQIAAREATLQALIRRYNALIDQYETDPGLKIQLG